MKTVDKYHFNEQQYVYEDEVQTFVANHTVLKRPFTLKMSSQGMPNEKENYNYLMKEAQVLKKLVHPNIYKCHKLLKSKNNFYVIYDQIQGETLQVLLKTGILYQKKLLIVKQIIEVMLFVSTNNFAYLNLHPKNINVINTSKVVLKNFGLAEEFEKSDILIKLPKFEGKINLYTPPEIEQGQVYPNSDLYSLGVLIDTLFEKQFEFGVNEDQKNKVSVRNQANKINQELTLQFLREFVNALKVKNPKERKMLINLLKPNLNKIKSAKSLSPSPKKNILNELGISRNLQTSKQLGMSTRSISDIGQRNQLQLNTVQELVLLIIKKRNFAKLLLDMSEIVLNNRQASISSIMILSFLLVKKGALAISQLAKFIKQGSNKEISITAKFREYFQKTEAYTQLSTSVNKEMVIVQNSFQQMLSKIKLLPSFSTNQLLQNEVRFQKVNNNFFRRVILDFLLENQLLATEEYCQQYKGKPILYFYLLSLMSDYDTLEQMHETLFTDGLCGFQKEPFILYFNLLSSIKIMELIESNSSNLFSEENYRSPLAPLAVKSTLTIK